MKFKLPLLFLAVSAIVAASSSAQATPAYRACLHESAARYLMGEDLPGGWGSMGNAILGAANYCGGTLRLSRK